MERFLQKNTVDNFLRGNSVSLADRKDKTQQIIRESRIKSIGEANRLIKEV